MRRAKKEHSLWFVCGLGLKPILAISLPFSLVTPFVSNAPSCPSLPLFLGNEYSKSDFRWNIYDPTVLSLELLTVLVAGPLALVIAWTIITNNKYRHPLQLIICVAEIYGGWMTFGPGTIPLHSHSSPQNASFRRTWRARCYFHLTCIPLFKNHSPNASFLQMLYLIWRNIWLNYS